MLRGVQWYFIVALSSIFLTISDIEHLFIHLLIIWISSLGKHLTMSLAHFNYLISFFVIDL